MSADVGNIECKISEDNIYDELEKLIDSVDADERELKVELTTISYIKILIFMFYLTLYLQNRILITFYLIYYLQSKLLLLNKNTLDLILIIFSFEFL